MKYVPELFCNLFSIPMALRNGCTLEGLRDKLIIKEDKQKYFFDERIRSGNEILFGIKITGETNELKLNEKNRTLWIS